MCDFFFAFFALQCLKVFAARANFLHHLTKELLTMRITKATKSGGFETRPYIFLRPLRSLWLHYFFFVLFVRFVVKICLSLLTLFWLRLRPVGPFVVVLDFSCLVAALPR